MRKLETVSAADVGRALGVTRQAVAQSIRRDTTVSGFDARPFAVANDDGTLAGFRDTIYDAIDIETRSETGVETEPETVVGNSGNSLLRAVSASLIENPTSAPFAPNPTPALSGWPAMGAVARDVLVAQTPQAAVAVDALADNLPVMLPLIGAILGAAMVDSEDRLMGAAIGAGAVLFAQLLHRNAGAPVQNAGAPVQPVYQALSGPPRVSMSRETLDRMIASIPTPSVN
jgi:hypothetical protein